uniref:Uncharacterized protein n=1 Tax=Chrysotila carterae TaxID=13221 RepID=A0A7S4BPW5_CHRCT|mmetsp:Transcript_24635/g.53776  ORF Transcript_24635/g.53776 Transcript_24635/m.53776 type:complete len:169 (-) Transcript_24635:533-1039(-)
MSRDPQNARAAEPYSSRLATLFAMLFADVLLNALAHPNAQPPTQLAASLLLVFQTLLRLCMLALVCAIAAAAPRPADATPAWNDGSGGATLDFLVALKGTFGTYLLAILVGLVLRVYELLLASNSDDFPTLSEWFDEPWLISMIVLNLAASLLLYYVTVAVAHAVHVA